MDTESVLHEFWDAEDADARPNKHDGVAFILRFVIRDSKYSKWFSLLGTDPDTGKSLKFQVRNGIVDDYIKNTWPGLDHADHWDLYNELAANAVPMVWHEDKRGYFIPLRPLSATKFKRLSWHMKGIGRHGSLDHYMWMRDSRKKAREVTMWEN